MTRSIQRRKRMGEPEETKSKMFICYFVNVIPKCNYSLHWVSAMTIQYTCNLNFPFNNMYLLKW